MPFFLTDKGFEPISTEELIDSVRLLPIDDNSRKALGIKKTVSSASEAVDVFKTLSTKSFEHRNVFVTLDLKSIFNFVCKGSIKNRINDVANERYGSFCEDFIRDTKVLFSKNSNAAKAEFLEVFLNFSDAKSDFIYLEQTDLDDLNVLFNQFSQCLNLMAENKAVPDEFKELPTKYKLKEIYKKLGWVHYDPSSIPTYGTKVELILKENSTGKVQKALDEVGYDFDTDENFFYHYGDEVDDFTIIAYRELCSKVVELETE